MDHQAIESDDALLDVLNLFPSANIHFIPLETLEIFGTFPRCPDCDGISVDLNSIDHDNSLLVFVSHNWLRGDSTCEGWDGSPHPDNASGDKYKACLEGIRRLKDHYAPRMSHCYIWMDYMCMNQESKDLIEELEKYDKIVASCDCVFTPTVCSSMSHNYFRTSYLAKAWCRMEMIYAANIPLDDRVDCNGLLRHTKFEDGLRNLLAKGVRPHFVFPFFYLETSMNPYITTPLQDIMIHSFHPLQGQLTKESDLDSIILLMEILQPYIDAKKLVNKYDGELNDRGERHGHGVMVYATDDRYDGEWSNGKSNGHGKFNFRNGDCYEGDFLNNAMHGKGWLKRGTFEYTGDFVNNKMCGLGKMSYDNGDSYEGGWKDNMRSGFGVFRGASGDVYEGEWKDGEINGHGVYRYCNGYEYEGSWKNNLQHGFGKCLSVKGDEYSGEWLNGKREGQGVHVAANGDRYDGEWKDNKKEGSGRYIFANGDVYEGDWRSDLRHGFGVLQCVNGAMYDGEWKADLKNGFGEYRYANVDVYRGEWKNNLQDGRGRLQFIDGECYEGDSKNDQRHGNGICRLPNGDVYDGEWENDLRHGHGYYRIDGISEYKGGFRYDKKNGWGIEKLAQGLYFVGIWVDNRLDTIYCRWTSDVISK